MHIRSYEFQGEDVKDIKYYSELEKPSSTNLELDKLSTTNQGTRTQSN